MEPEGASPVLEQPEKIAAPRKYYFRCPHCGNDEEFVRPTEDGHLGCAMLLLGGLLAANHVNEYRKHRVQCVRCLHMFQQPALRVSAVAAFGTVIQVLTILLVVAGVIFYGYGDLITPLPEWPILFWIEEAIAAKPRVAAYFLVALVVTMLFVPIIAGWIGNRSNRRQLAEKFLLRPPSAHTLPASVPAPQAPSSDHTPSA